MNNAWMTLSDFFSFDVANLPDEYLSGVGSAENVASLKEAVGKKIGGEKWPVALREVIRKIEDLLQISIPDIMVGAWKKYGSIMECIHKSKDSPEETF